MFKGQTSERGPSLVRVKYRTGGALDLLAKHRLACNNTVAGVFLYLALRIRQAELIRTP